MGGGCKRIVDPCTWVALGQSLAALAVALCCMPCLGEAAVPATDSQWKSSMAPLVLPLAHGHFNSTLALPPSGGMRRNLMGEARVWLYGHVLTRGYYYTNLNVGTPPQRFALIVDTGSTVTYVPCSTCTKCGTHQDKPYKPSASSTYKVVPCQSAACPGQNCDGEARCAYARHYAEDSSTRGILADDVVGFGDASTIGPARILFGCETEETGDLFNQKADGIIGLGRGPLGIVDQLVGQGALADTFSLCYGGWEKGGGAAVFGATALPPGMLFTPLVVADGGSPNVFYNVRIESLSVGGKALDLPAGAFDQGYGVVLDSGTTFTYLPPAVFAHFKAAVMAGAKGLEIVEGPDPEYNDICFANASSNGSDLGQRFAEIAFVFGGGVTYKLAPENYLFRHRKVQGGWCLGIFQNGDGGTLIGGITVRNTLVTYDRAGRRVGFWKTDCDALFEELHSLGAGGGGSDDPDTTSALPPDLAHEPADQGAPAPATQPPQPPPPQPEAPLPPAPPPLPASSSGNGSTPGCDGCASRIVVTMTLAAEFAQFSEMTPEFLADMVRELDLGPDQVELVTYNQTDDGGVALQFLIVPGTPATNLPVALSERLQAALKSNQLGLRDAFGTYQVTTVEVIPATPERRHGFRDIWALAAGAAALVVVLILVVLIICLCRRRHQWAARKYAHMVDTIDEDVPEEEETLDGPADRL